MVLNPITFVKESYSELGKVQWPSRNETIRYTIIVAVVSIIVGVYIAGLDAIFAKFAEAYLYK
jgi:preprotein translocase subunit SecE